MKAKGANAPPPPPPPSGGHTGVGWGPQRLYIIHRDGRPLTAEEDGELRTKYMGDLGAAIRNGGNIGARILRWQWRDEGIELTVDNAVDAAAIRQRFDTPDLRCLTEAEYRQVRRPAQRRFFGLIRGNERIGLTSSLVDYLVEEARRRLGIDSTLAAGRRINTQDGVIITLVADEEAAAAFIAGGQTLWLGTAGVVPFTEQRKNAGRRRALASALARAEALRNRERQEANNLQRTREELRALEDSTALEAVEMTEGGGRPMMTLWTSRTSPPLLRHLDNNQS